MDIQQLVYGYNKGHSLLNSSIDLSVEDKSVLLELTDWSGVNELNIPTYITGFPLIKSNYYALIRTWYAEEMSRPGCVWSHVLLINKVYFSEITYIEYLNCLFLRPSISDKNFEGYNKAITIDNNAISTLDKFSKIELNDLYIKKLIFNIYSTNDPIYIGPDSNSNSLESLFFKLWWIQPINDRFLFSFSTGSSSPRKYLNKEIQLQIIEKESFKQDLVNFNSITEEEITSKPWVNIIYEGFTSNNSKYIKYLNNISDDIKPNQQKTIELAYLFELINNEGDKYDSKSLVTNLLDSLVKFFPEKAEARKLKRALLSQNVLLSLKEEVFFLQKIVNIESYSSFDIDDLHINSRVIEIYHSDKNIFFELLSNIIKYNVNELGVSIFTKSSTLINENDISVLISNYWSLFIIYVTIRPSLISFNESWNITESQCLEIINILLLKENSGNVNWQFILNKVFDKQIRLLPKMIIPIQNIEPLYISFLLDWYNANPHRKLQHQWINELSNNPDKVLDWIELKNNIDFSTMSLIVKIIDPNSRSVINRGAALWIPFSISAANNNIKESIYFHAFLTSLAFNFNDSDAFRLLKNSFSTVYQNIANDTLDYNLISMVLVRTKPLFWQEWDKCKTLRNALADKFNEARWDTSLLIEITKNKLLSEEIYSLCKKRR